MGEETTLSSKDWEKLDKKFSGLHGRINGLGESMTEKVNRVNTKVEVLKNAPNVAGHEKNFHSAPAEQANGKPIKFWTIIIAVVTGVSAGIGFLLAMLKEMFSG